MESEELMKGRVNGEEVVMVSICTDNPIHGGIVYICHAFLGVSGYEGKAHLAKGMDAEEVFAITTNGCVDMLTMHNVHLSPLLQYSLQDDGDGSQGLHKSTVSALYCSSICTNTHVPSFSHHTHTHKHRHHSYIGQRKVSTCKREVPIYFLL